MVKRNSTQAGSGYNFVEVNEFGCRPFGDLMQKEYALWGF
jgi:hypothetical protein